MTTHTHTHTRPVSAPPYYQGRPAAFWVAVFGRKLPAGDMSKTLFDAPRAG